MMALAEEKQGVRSPLFLQSHARRTGRCRWQCQQNGAECDPGSANTCDCVAHGCGNPEVAYSAAATDETTLGSRSDSLLMIPIVLGIVLVMCCCTFIFIKTTEGDSSSSPRSRGFGNSEWLKETTSIFRGMGITRHKKQKENQAQPGNSGVSTKIKVGVITTQEHATIEKGTANNDSRSRSPSPKLRPVSNPRPASPVHSPRSRAGSPKLSGPRSPRPTAHHSHSPSLGPAKQNATRRPPSTGLVVDAKGDALLVMAHRERNSEERSESSSNRSRSPKARLESKGRQRNSEETSEASSNRSRSPKVRLHAEGPTWANNEDQKSETSSNRSRSPKIYKEKPQSKRGRSPCLQEGAAEYNVADLFVCRASQKTDARVNIKSQKNGTVSEVSTGIGSKTTISRTTVSRDLPSSLLSLPPVQTSALSRAADASLDATLTTAGQQRLSATLQLFDAESPRTRKK